MPRHPGRSGSDWERVRKEVLANATVCAECGGLLDFDAPPRSPQSPSVDHRFPLALMRGMAMEDQRKLALDPANLRAVHYGCNSRRGARPPRQFQRASRRW